MNLRRAFLPVLLAFWFGIPAAISVEVGPATTRLTIDLAKTGAPVSPTLYGLMVEEINYSFDGGIYGELVRNRSFQNHATHPAYWSVVNSPKASASIALDSTQPLSPALTTSLRLDVVSATANNRAGIANPGYWGIPVRPATAYRASFHAKAAEGFDGAVTVSLESEDGSTVYGKAEGPRLTSEWQSCAVTLMTDKAAPISKARLVLAVDRPGTVWFSLVSLFPPTWNQRPNGNRIDLMQMLVDMKPTFLRFPGGNYLEGQTIATRFDWKKTLGKLTERPGHKGPWGYRSTDGMGLLEFLEWSEDLKVEPVLGVYAGYSLHDKPVVAGPELEPFVQDALDEIEYIIGGPGTPWGARRAADGHPAPFKLTYVEIGNEDWLDRSGSYEGRYAQFHDAIKAKYPQLKLIATTAVKSRRPDLIDEHIYRDPDQMQDEADRYDRYSRTGEKIFVGEWAAREGASPTTNLRAALGDAAWLTGMERNSDLVELSCYAPLFVNVNPGGMQWKSNLIGYDALSCYGSPSYYVQQMFASYLGDRVVPITAEGIPERTWQPRPRRDGSIPSAKQVPLLFHVATRDTRSGALYLKVVNTSAAPLPVQINLAGTASIEPQGTAVVLTSDLPTDTNTISQPRKIVPVTTSLTNVKSEFTRVLEPYSVTVLQLRIQPTGSAVVPPVVSSAHP
jgi:alpha-L-arabinofuranosidase